MIYLPIASTCLGKWFSALLLAIRHEIVTSVLPGVASSCKAPSCKLSYVIHPLTAIQDNGICRGRRGEMAKIQACRASCHWRKEKWGHKVLIFPMNLQSVQGYMLIVCCCGMLTRLAIIWFWAVETGLPFRQLVKVYFKEVWKIWIRVPCSRLQRLQQR